MNDISADVIQNLNDMPTVEQACLEWGLYQDVLIEMGAPGIDPIITAANIHNFLVGHTPRLDFYCPGCKRRATFSTTGAGNDVKFIANRTTGTHLRHFRCARDDNHRAWFLFRQTIPEKDTGAMIQITKIGQYPSHADLYLGDLKEYSKALEKEDLRELTKASRCASQSYNTGALVYLRRIFERLLRSTHKENEGSLDVDADEFAKLHMNEKVEKLAKFLPHFLLGHPNVIYQKLSDGIHNLDEDTCGEYFPVLEDCINLILQQSHERKERERLEADLTDRLPKLKGT